MVPTSFLQKKFSRCFCFHMTVLVRQPRTRANSRTKEWAVAEQAMGILDDVVPYCVTVGNHDLGPGGTTQNRNADLFNVHFGPGRFEKKPWYGGHFESGNENAFYFIDAGGQKFLIVCRNLGHETKSWSGPTGSWTGISTIAQSWSLTAIPIQTIPELDKETIGTRMVTGPRETMAMKSGRNSSGSTRIYFSF